METLFPMKLRADPVSFLFYADLKTEKTTFASGTERMIVSSKFEKVITRQDKYPPKRERKWEEKKSPD